MKYTPEEVMQFVQEEDVKFIRLAFCNVYGKQHNVAIMPAELKRAFTYGIAFDASAVEGFGGEIRSDLLLHPDPSTLIQLPWRPEQGKVVRMFCDISYPDGRPFERDTRSILKRAVATAGAKGFRFAFGAEMEFYLFRLDEYGEPTRIPYDRAGYMDIAPDDRGETIRREICLMLERMGICPESSHHESGPGQNEIDFRYSDPLAAADNAVTFHAMVRTVAAQNGLCASFSPKPLADCDAHQRLGQMRREHPAAAQRHCGDPGEHPGDDAVSEPLRGVLLPPWQRQSPALRDMVGGKPLPADPHPGGGGRIPPRRAALCRPDDKPVYCLHAPDLCRDVWA